MIIKGHPNIYVDINSSFTSTSSAHSLRDKKFFAKKQKVQELKEASVHKS